MNGWRPSPGRNARWARLSRLALGATSPARWCAPTPTRSGFKVGELDGSDSERAHELASIMNHVENTEVTTDLIGERWSKLIINNMNNAIAGLDRSGGRPRSGLLQSPGG